MIRLSSIYAVLIYVSILLIHWIASHIHHTVCVPVAFFSWDDPYGSISAGLHSLLLTGLYTSSDICTGARDIMYFTSYAMSGTFRSYVIAAGVACAIPQAILQNRRA